MLFTKFKNFYNLTGKSLQNSVSNHLTFLFPSKKLYTWKNVCPESTGGCSFPIWIPKDLRIIHLGRTQIFWKANTSYLFIRTRIHAYKR